MRVYIHICLGAYKQKGQRWLDSAAVLFPEYMCTFTICLSTMKIYVRGGVLYILFRPERAACFSIQDWISRRVARA